MEAIDTFELPYPPSVNTYWRMWRGRMVISTKGRAYRDTVCSALRSFDREPLLGPVCVAIALFPPDRRKRDCDNTLKALLDALGHAGIYADDSQITWLLTIKAEVVPGGKVLVHCWQRGTDDPRANQLEAVSAWICSHPNLN